MSSPNAHGLPRLSQADNLLFNVEVSLPTVLQGAFARRPAIVAAAARTGADGRAILRVARLRRKYGPGPVWVRDLGERALLVLSREDVRRVLENSPAVFAGDPEGKKRGMAVFQPDAVTISRGAQWANRRRFNDAVLDGGMREHGERFLTVCREEMADLIDEVAVGPPGKSRGPGLTLDWPMFHRAFERIARRVVLGDGALADVDVSRLLGELMRDANRIPAKRSMASQARYDQFTAHILGRVADAEPGSLVGLFGQAPQDATTCPDGQVPHWLFGIQDTLATNVYRTLAVVLAHPEQRRRVEKELAAADLTTPAGVAALQLLPACLQEVMRLWPTTTLLSRITVAETEWNGAIVPPDTKVLIYSAFHHRDRRYYAFADRFAPRVWLPGGAAVDDWTFNHLGHGPMGCPGRDLALILGTAVLAELISKHRLRPADRCLDARRRRMPYQLNPFRLRFELRPHIARQRSSEASVHHV